jgi:hypothetical protein
MGTNYLKSGDIHQPWWALIRYRLPLDFELLIFTGYNIVDFTNREGNRHRVSFNIIIKIEEYFFRTSDNWLTL